MIVVCYSSWDILNDSRHDVSCITGNAFRIGGSFEHHHYPHHKWCISCCQCIRYIYFWLWRCATAINIFNAYNDGVLSKELNSVEKTNIVTKDNPMNSLTGNTIVRCCVWEFLLLRFTRKSVECKAPLVVPRPLSEAGYEVCDFDISRRTSSVYRDGYHTVPKDYTPMMNGTTKSY